MSKAKDIAFVRPNLQNYVPLDKISGIERVAYVKVLGIVIESTINR